MTEGNCPPMRLDSRRTNRASPKGEAYPIISRDEAHQEFDVTQTPPFPEWADPTLSADLPRLRSLDEGVVLEFKREIPEQASDLAKEIAAFASTAGGKILLGVTDDGAFPGVAGAQERTVRDQLIERVAGICAKSIDPSVKAEFAFAAEAERVALVITVAAGPDPLYYVSGRPYVRDQRSSRPARPGEVIERVRRFLSAPEGRRRDRDSAMLSGLGSILANVAITANEAGDRTADGGLELTLAALRDAAGEIRNMIADYDISEATRSRLTAFIKLLATTGALDPVRAFHAWNILEATLVTIESDARSLRADLLDHVQLSAESAEDVNRNLRRLRNRCADLNTRVDELLADWNIEEMRADATQLGAELRQYAFHIEGRRTEADVGILTSAARELHLIDTRPQYEDGGHSLRRIATEIKEACKAVVTALARY